MDGLSHASHGIRQIFMREEIFLQGLVLPSVHGEFARGGPGPGGCFGGR